MLRGRSYDSNTATTGWKHRAWLLTGIVAFVGAFQLVYLEWLNPVFAYSGFENVSPPLPYLVLAWVLSLLPGFWMPIRLTRPSQLIYWVLYCTVFIPSMFVPLYMGSNRRDEIAVLMLTFFAGLAIVGSSYLFRPLRLPQVRISSRLFWMSFILVTMGLALWVIAVLKGNLRIVSFADTGDVRFAASDLAIAKGSLVNYGLTWLSGVMGPFLLALGAVRRRYLIFAAGMLVQVLVYSAIAAKSVVVSIVVISIFYFILRDKGAGFGLKFAWGNALLLFGTYLLSFAQDSSVLFMILSLVFLRTFGIAGLMTGQYYCFFQQNPLTYYSHIKGVSWFVHYPYARTVAQELGFYYSGSPDYDANAHFWATDGLAAIGLPGVLLVSALCAVVFWLLDSASSRHDVRFTAPLVSFAALNVANISLFTSLLSGGLGIMILMLYLMPTETSGDVGWGKSRTASRVPSPV